MGTYNSLAVELTCPHCAEKSLMSVECKFGDTGQLAQLAVGDVYPWVARKAPQNGGRPLQGTSRQHGYTECERCGLDFFVDVDIENDVIAAAAPNLAQPGYKTATSPGGVVYYDQGDFCPEDPKPDYLYRSWYSKHLSAMGVPSLLFARVEPNEAYRFLWLRTFHHPISVLAVRGAESASASFVELDGAGGYDPGAVASSGSTILTPDAWAQLAAAVSSTGIWDGPRTGDSIGIDGSQWVFEAVRSGTRRVAHCWSPKAGPFREAGMQFLTLAGLDPHPVY